MAYPQGNRGFNNGGNRGFNYGGQGLVPGQRPGGPFYPGVRPGPSQPGAWQRAQQPSSFDRHAENIQDICARIQNAATNQQMAEAPQPVPPVQKSVEQHVDNIQDICARIQSSVGNQDDVHNYGKGFVDQSLQEPERSNSLDDHVDSIQDICARIQSTAASQDQDAISSKASVVGRGFQEAKPQKSFDEHFDSMQDIVARIQASAEGTPQATAARGSPIDTAAGKTQANPMDLDEKLSQVSALSPQQVQDRLKKGFPPQIPGFTLVCSLVVRIRNMPAHFTEEKLMIKLNEIGPVQHCVVAPSAGRKMGFVTMTQRKHALRVMGMNGLDSFGVALECSWQPGKGLLNVCDAESFKEYWKPDLGATYLPWNKLPAHIRILEIGGVIDEDTLPPNLRQGFSQNAGGVPGMSGPMAPAAMAQQAMQMGMTPQAMRMKAQAMGMGPQAMAMNAQAMGMGPQAMGMGPQAMGMTPQAMGMTPQAMAMMRQQGMGMRMPGAGMPLVGAAMHMGLQPPIPGTINPLNPMASSVVRPISVGALTKDVTEMSVQEMLQMMMKGEMSSEQVEKAISEKKQREELEKSESKSEITDKYDPEDPTTPKLPQQLNVWIGGISHVLRPRPTAFQVLDDWIDSVNAQVATQYSIKKHISYWALNLHLPTDLDLDSIRMDVEPASKTHLMSTGLIPKGRAHVVHQIKEWVDELKKIFENMPSAAAAIAAIYKMKKALKQQRMAFLVSSSSSGRKLPSKLDQHLTVGSTTLLVSHIDHQATQDDIEFAMSAFGHVMDVKMMSKMHVLEATVEFELRQEACKALEQNNATVIILGSKAKMKWAQGEGLGRLTGLARCWQPLLGFAYIDWKSLKWNPARMTALSLGSVLDEDSAPAKHKDLIVALNECYFWDKKRVAHMYLESELMEAQRVLDILSGQEGSQHRNLMNQVKPLMDFTQRRTAANMDRRRRDLNANQRITGSNSNRRRTDSNSIKKETDSRSSEEKTADIESIKKKTKPKKKKIDLSAALNDWQQQWKENKCSLAVVSDMEKGRKAQGLPPLKVNHFCLMSRVLFFGGIKSIGVEEKEIQELAEKNGGPVENVKIIQARGCAFVTMGSSSAAKKVKETLDGQKVTLDNSAMTLKVRHSIGMNFERNFPGDHGSYWDVEEGVAHVPWDKMKGFPAVVFHGFDVDEHSLSAKKHASKDWKDLVAAQQSRDRKQKFHEMNWPLPKSLYVTVFSTTVSLDKLKGPLPLASLTRYVKKCGKIKDIMMLSHLGPAYIVMETRSGAQRTLAMLQDIFNHCQVVWEKGAGVRLLAACMWNPLDGMMYMPFSVAVQTPLREMGNGGLVDEKSLPPGKGVEHTEKRLLLDIDEEMKPYVEEEEEEEEEEDAELEIRMEEGNETTGHSAHTAPKGLVDIGYGEPENTDYADNEGTEYEGNDYGGNGEYFDQGTAAGHNDDVPMEMDQGSTGEENTEQGEEEAEQAPMQGLLSGLSRILDVFVNPGGQDDDDADSKEKQREEDDHRERSEERRHSRSRDSRSRDSRSRDSRSPYRGYSPERDSRRSGGLRRDEDPDDYHKRSREYDRDYHRDYDREYRGDDHRGYDRGYDRDYDRERYPDDGPQRRESYKDLERYEGEGDTYRGAAAGRWDDRRDYSQHDEWSTGIFTGSPQKRGLSREAEDYPDEKRARKPLLPTPVMPTHYPAPRRWRDYRETPYEGKGHSAEPEEDKAVRNHPLLPTPKAAAEPEETEGKDLEEIQAEEPEKNEGGEGEGTKRAPLLPTPKTKESDQPEGEGDAPKRRAPLLPTPVMEKEDGGAQRAPLLATPREHDRYDRGERRDPYAAPPPSSGIWPVRRASPPKRHGHPSEEGRGGERAYREEGHRDARREGHGDARREGYGDPRREGHRDARPEGYGFARREGYGDARREGYGDARREGYGDARREGSRDARREGHGDARREGYGDSRREGYRDARREGHGEARREGYGDARREGYGDARREGHGEARREGYGDARREGHGEARRPPRRQEEERLASYRTRSRLMEEY